MLSPRNVDPRSCLLGQKPRLDPRSEQWEHFDEHSKQSPRPLHVVADPNSSIALYELRGHDFLFIVTVYMFICT